MDYTLSILIPKKDLEKIKIVEILFEWGGETFSQDPKKYKFGSTLEFREITDRGYFQEIIGSELDIYDYVALYLEGNNIQLLRLMLNNQDFNIKDSELIKFIFELYKSLDIFCIINDIDDERIDNKYFVTNVNEVVDIFINSLSWTLPKGVVIIKNKFSGR